jgi:hypothetical protein
MISSVSPYPMLNMEAAPVHGAESGRGRAGRSAERRAMVCVICHFETELDDVVAQSGGRCVCLRCYGRETGSELQMPKLLRRELTAVLAGVG